MNISCNTMQGAGEDIQSAGETIEDAAEWFIFDIVAGFLILFDILQLVQWVERWSAVKNEGV